MKRTLEEILELIKNYSKGRNYKVFFVFVLISTFFWVLIKFSKIYTVTDVFSVEYVSIPEDLSWSKINESELSMNVSASGFKLLNYALLGKNLEIDLSKIKKYSGNQYYILPEQQFVSIKKQFSNSVNLSYLGPDTIHFDFSKKLEKKVAVRLMQDLELEKSYKYLEPILLDPDSVTISGPSSIVSTIDFIETVTFKKKNIKESSKSIIGLRSFEDKRVNFSVHSVNVVIKVEKITQNTIVVPVVLENVPKGFLLKTFPDNVEIIFNTGLSDYESINATTFEVVADYNKLEGNNKLTIPLKVTVLSERVELIKVEPVEVEFLLRRIGQ